jgi:hypothetical protein
MNKKPIKDHHYLIIHQPHNEPTYTHWSGVAMCTGNTMDIMGECFGFIVNSMECWFPIESIIKEET